LLAGRLSKSETETLKFVAGEDEEGDDGGTKEFHFAASGKAS
jgi:hypothetical protein